MNKKVKNYTEFNTVLKESLDSNNHTTKRQAKYSSDDWKNICSKRILESENALITEKYIMDLHSMYEATVLLESRANWFEKLEETIFLDAESHVILIRDKESFIIEKKTLEFMLKEEWSISGLINKGKKIIGDIAGAAIDIGDDIRVAMDKVGEKITKGAKWLWDKLSSGAQKAWGFFKTCVSAAAKLVSEMKPTEKVALICSILAAILGIVGIGNPGIGAIAGYLMMMAGGIHIYDGVGEIKHAKHIMKDAPFDPTIAYVTAFMKAAPDFVAGTIGVLLGSHDVAKGFSSIADPTAGASALAVQEGAKTAGEKFIHGLSSGGEAIEKAVEAVVHKVVHGPAASLIEKSVCGILPWIAKMFFERILPGVYKAVLTGMDVLLKGFEWLINIPSNIKAWCDKVIPGLEKGNALYKIVAKGLKYLVKPLMTVLSKLVDIVWRPMAQGAREIVNSLKAANDYFEKNKDVESQLAKALMVEKQPEVAVELKPVVTTIAPSGGLESSPEDAKNLAKLEEEEGKEGESNDSESKEEKAKEKEPEAVKDSYKSKKYLVKFENFKY